MKNTKQLTRVAMYTAIIFLLTYFVSVPTGLFGNVNLGDCAVLLSGIILGLPGGFLASAIGASLADLLGPYAVYAPATFIIKGCMSLACYIPCKMLKKQGSTSDFISFIISGCIAIVVLVFGYFLYELALYGLSVAVTNIVFNLIQGFVNLALATVLLNPVKMIVSRFDNNNE